MDNKLTVKFWGTRGAFPFYQESHQYLGGDTSAIEVRLNNDRIFIDGGSGLNYPKESDEDEILLLSHCHLDHIIGLPYFLTKKKKGLVTIISGKSAHETSIEDKLRTIFGNVAFPVTLETIHHQIAYKYIDVGEWIQQGSWLISIHPLNHPGNATGFRLRHLDDPHEIVYLVDHEHGSALDQQLIDFADSADLLIWDGCYNDKDLKVVKGFGHSSWEQGLWFQDQSGCRVLAITGHAVKRDDVEAQTIESSLNPATAFLARDRQIFRFD